MALILRTLGQLLFVFSCTLLPSIFIAWIYAEPIVPWVSIMLIILTLGLAFWYPNRNTVTKFEIRDGFLLTVLVWLSCSTVTAGILFWVVEGISVEDAAFEAVSALTTTGATIMTGLEHMPKSILFFRQLLQWVGGVGIIFLGILILPALQIGGMQLRPELSTSATETNFMPSRFKSHAKWLFATYVALTLCCALCYTAAGMSVFDGFAHAFSTTSIGGFSTYDDSIGYFNNPAIELVCMLFMVIGAINFGLHYNALLTRSWQTYKKDAEWRFFIYSLLLVSALLCIPLLLRQDISTALSWREGLFQAISFVTTTGFTTTATHDWPVPVLLVLIISACIGGCSGSMAGGLKSFRILILLKQIFKETTHLIHPKAIAALKIGNTVIPPRVQQSLWAFMAVWLVSFVLLFAGAILAGMDAFSAFSAVAACLTNLGPGQGTVADNYGHIPLAAKYILIVAMLLGRLEIFTLLVILTPSYWRR
ncbi:MAG: TrkH family potassium uptake protein [Gammaproteobacteria bacterium]